MTNFVFTTHLVFTAIMCGVVWTVQLVHYPSFFFIKENDFPDFEEFHSVRISLIAVPIMLIELLSGLCLLFVFKSDTPTFLYVNFLFLVFTWIFTFVISSPTHGKLLNGFNGAIVESLIKSNWMRTALWTVRAFGLLIFAYLT